MSEKQLRPELVKEFHNIAEEVLAMTSSMAFSQDEEQMEAEAESYANLMERREPLVDRLVALNNKIIAIPSASGQDESDALWLSALDIVKRIESLDKSHMAAAEQMMSRIKGSIKDIKQGQTLSNAYMHPGEQQPSSLLLDAKQ